MTDNYRFAWIERDSQPIQMTDATRQFLRAMKEMADGSNNEYYYVEKGWCMVLHVCQDRREAIAFMSIPYCDVWKVYDNGHLELMGWIGNDESEDVTVDVERVIGYDAEEVVVDEEEEIDFTCNEKL